VQLDVVDTVADSRICDTKIQACLKFYRR